MAGPVAQQVITSMSIIMGKDGTDDGEEGGSGRGQADIVFRGQIIVIFFFFGTDLFLGADNCGLGVGEVLSIV